MSSATGEPDRHQRSLEKQVNATTVLDRVFYWLTVAFAIAVVAILLWIGFQIGSTALPAIRTYGIQFLTTTTWDPVRNIYGALPQIYGTLVTSLIALLIAVPVGVGVAVFLSENFLPNQIRTPIALAIELIAAIPSVVIGLWGILRTDSIFITFLSVSVRKL